MDDAPFCPFDEGQCAAAKDAEHSAIVREHIRFEPPYALVAPDPREVPEDKAGDALPSIFLVRDKGQLRAPD